MRRDPVILACVLAAAACASNPLSVPQGADFAGVSIAFDHFGRAADPFEQRMAESGEMPQANQAGTDYWLRLNNRSGHAISFQTLSTYVKQPIEWFDIGGGNRVIALPDRAQIAIRYGLESRRGTQLETGGGDMFWMSTLPSDRSVLFSVPRAALARGRRLFIDFRPADE